jgi:2-dehydropantoate 2-reductase
VRAKRAAVLLRTGLSIRSKLGDFDLAAPPMLTEDAITGPFDLILLSCKAYDLDGAMESFAPAVGPDTAILPLLNGMGHLDSLANRFGAAHILGGQCLISTDLDAEGRVRHLNDLHLLTFGEQDGSHSARIKAIAATLSGAKFDARLSENILQEMWEKWVFIAAGAGISCLMRAAIGDIVVAGAADLSTELFDECAAIAAMQGFPPRPEFLARMRPSFTAPGSPLTASMLRDIEHGGRVEADHILGDLLRRGGASPNPHALLRIAYAHVKAYEARRLREQAVEKAANA